MDTSVLFIIFNRPDTTKVVFERIRESRPKRLYVAADGPRDTKRGEVARCEEARSIIREIDWDCSVQTLFSDANLGCMHAVSAAINWFFSHEEEGIILEDDCLPDLSFFTYCSELLARYRHDQRIMHISGTTLQGDRNITGEASYYFSGYPHIWGWATWRRAWKHYQLDPAEKLRSMHLPLPYFNSRVLWTIREVVAGRLDTWDVQWLITMHSQHGLSILPKVCLIRNIGFGMDATHTIRVPSWVKSTKYGSLSELVHPTEIKRNDEADLYESKKFHRQVWYLRPIEQIYYWIKPFLDRKAKVNLSQI